MVRYSKLNRVMEVRNHFKNGASSKSQTSRENFGITQVLFKYSRISMLAMIAFFLVSTVYARTELNTRQAAEKTVLLEEKEIQKSEIEVLKEFLATEKVEFEHLQSSLEHLQSVHHSKKICKLMKKIEKHQQISKRRISSWERQISNFEQEARRVD